MRIPKTKPKIGRKEPYYCAKHPKRLAIVTVKGVNCCHVCWSGEDTRHGKRWVKCYEERGI